MVYLVKIQETEKLCSPFAVAVIRAEGIWETRPEARRTQIRSPGQIKTSRPIQTDLSGHQIRRQLLLRQVASSLPDVSLKTKAKFGT